MPLFNIVYVASTRFGIVEYKMKKLHLCMGKWSKLNVLSLQIPHWGHPKVISRRQAYICIFCIGLLIYFVYWSLPLL